MMNERIEAIMREAGGMILSAHPEKNSIRRKAGPANFVTDHDVRIQRFLIENLSRLFPGCGFYGEEDTEGNKRRIEGRVFFIDPIDGTTNFLFDYHNSCVSVGMADDGRMIAGWVYDPYTDQLWSAERGEGAKLNGQELRIEDKGIEEGIVAFGCARYNESDGIFDILPTLFNRSLSIRNGGSAAIDLCRIASGSNAAYVEMFLQPYDYAAASVIVEEAGGVIGSVDGKPITLNAGCSILAGTPEAVREIGRIVKDTEKKAY